jgi:hypothetical protein
MTLGKEYVINTIDSLIAKNLYERKGDNKQLLIVKDAFKTYTESREEKND